jgi:hypothetical protein
LLSALRTIHFYSADSYPLDRRFIHWIGLRRKKKYLWFWFPTDPIFFCRPYYFFNAIDRATLFSLGVAAAKMASVVALIIEKNMKKIFKKKIISDLPTLIFLRYETGTTGNFFYALSTG